MEPIYTKLSSALTYFFSFLAGALHFMNEYAAGISALVAIIMLFVTIWFKAQHLKIAKDHGHNHNADGKAAEEESE